MNNRCCVNFRPTELINTKFLKNCLSLFGGVNFICCDKRILCKTCNVTISPSGRRLSSISASQCIVKREAKDLIMSCFTAAIVSLTVAFGNMNTLDDTTPLKCMLPSHSKYSTASGRAFS